MCLVGYAEEVSTLSISGEIYAKRPLGIGLILVEAHTLHTI